MKTALSFTIFCLLFLAACRNNPAPDIKKAEFPDEMVSFTPYDGNPVFKGTDTNTWDRTIRERGYILLENGIFKMWYTGYDREDSDPKALGYAISPDGLSWTRYRGNPLFSEKWTEDMFVLKFQDKYYMYAEGTDDVAHLLTSEDGISWQEQGDLTIRMTNGDSIPGPYGTPNIVIENGKWYLFYERMDEGIWIATSTDHRSWINIQDEPVLNKGPENYDLKMVAANQVFKYKDRYYMYYHGLSGDDRPGAPGLWTSSVAASADLIYWVKYPGNPIVSGDHSSPILVFDGRKYRLYTMHPAVCLYFSK
jgi:predicted GH43/DUF377 family glycosyl hydrolase